MQAIHHIHSLPETDQYNTLGIPANIEETRATIKPWIEANQSINIENYTFAIEAQFDKAFIGLFGLRLSANKYKKAEVWYLLLPKYWNQGLATEVLCTVIDFGFDQLHLHRIEAGCAVDNIGSIKVLEKAGMIREGRRRKILPLASGWSDNYTYAILETDERTRLTKAK